MSGDSACTESQTEINERQAETGLSSRISARDVYRGFHGKSNRVVCSQPNGIYGTNGTAGRIHTRRKNRSMYDKIRRKRPCVSDFSGRVKFSSSVLSRIQRSFGVRRRFDWNARESDRRRNVAYRYIYISLKSGIRGFDDSIGKYHLSPVIQFINYLWPVAVLRPWQQIFHTYFAHCQLLILLTIARILLTDLSITIAE